MLSRRMVISIVLVLFCCCADFMVVLVAFCCFFVVLTFECIWPGWPRTILRSRSKMPYPQRLDSLFSISSWLVSGCAVPVSVCYCHYVCILCVRFPSQILAPPVQKFILPFSCTREVVCVKAACKKGMIWERLLRQFFIGTPADILPLSFPTSRNVEEGVVGYWPHGKVTAPCRTRFHAPCSVWQHPIRQEY